MGARNFPEVCSIFIVGVVFVLTSFSIVASALYVQDPSSSNQTLFFNSPHFDVGNSSFEVTGTLIAAAPDSAGCTLNLDMKGKIVLDGPTICSSEDKIRECQRVGCLGIVTEEYKQYCNTMISHERVVWGGYVETVALSQCFHCDITIHSADGKDILITYNNNNNKKNSNTKKIHNSNNIVNNNNNNNDSKNNNNNNNNSFNNNNNTKGKMMKNDVILLHISLSIVFINSIIIAPVVCVIDYNYCVFMYMLLLLLLVLFISKTN